MNSSTAGFARGGSFKAAFHRVREAAAVRGPVRDPPAALDRGPAARGAGGERRAGASLWQGSPYRGLERFDFDHALIYCGRTQAVAEAIDALRRLADKATPFLLVAGMSGSGKSSFVRAASCRC